MVKPFRYPSGSDRLTTGDENTMLVVGTSCSRNFSTRPSSSSTECATTFRMKASPPATETNRRILSFGEAPFTPTGRRAVAFRGSQVSHSLGLRLLAGETHSAQQILEARVAPERLKTRIEVHVGHEPGVLLVCLFQPG